MDQEGIIITICLLVYIVVILVIARLISKSVKSLSDFTLAGKRLPWFIIAASMMGTIANTAQVLGQAASSYMIGLSQGFWMLVVSTLFTLALLPRFGERLRHVACETIADLAEKRFPGSARMNYVLAIWSVLWGCFLSAVCVFGGSVMVENLLGIPWQVAVVIVTAVALIYTVLGGLAVSAVLDTIQYVVIGIVMATLFPVLYVKYGTFSTFMAQYVGPTGYELTAQGIANGFTEGFMDVFHLPGWGFWGFAAFVLACSLWIPVDLGMVQRFLAEKKSGEGKKGVWFYTIVFIPVCFIMSHLGFWAKGLYPGVEMADSVAILVARNALNIVGSAIFLMALTAAILSTIDAYFNASAAILTRNLYQRLRPGKSDRHYLTVIRIFTVLVAALTLALAPIIGIDGIVLSCVALQMVLCATLSPMLMLMAFWKRFTEKAAFWGILITTIVCVISIIAAGGAMNAITGAGLFGIPTLFIGFMVCIPIYVIVSLLQPYDESKTGPEFRALFNKSSKDQTGNLDIIATVCITLFFAAWAALGFSGVIGPWPTYSGTGGLVIDSIYIVFSLLSFFGVIYLSYRLYKFIFFDQALRKG